MPLSVGRNVSLALLWWAQVDASFSVLDMKGRACSLDSVGHRTQAGFDSGQNRAIIINDDSILGFQMTWRRQPKVT
jgi:hypothetical protein